MVDYIRTVFQRFNTMESASSQEAVSLDDNLERIYLRFAVIESDEQLQKFTDNYLVRLIETAASEPKALAKVGEILNHYSRRAKSSTSLRYPVQALMSLIRDKGTIATNLSMVYLRLAVATFSEEEHLDFLLLCLNTISDKVAETRQCAELLAFCFPALTILTQKEEHTWPQFSLSADVKTLLLRFLHCIVAFPIESFDAVKQKCAALVNGNSVPTPTITSDEFLLVAEKVFSRHQSIVQTSEEDELSKRKVNKALHLPTSQAQGSSSTISSNAEVKLCAIKLLGSTLFDDAAVFPILVLASAQNVDAVTDAAEAALKKMDIQLCVDSRPVVDELMAYYLGTVPSLPVLSKKAIISPASLLMKRKILPYLTRSAIAPITYMNNLKVCLDGLTQTSFPKLLIGSLEFLVKVIEKMPAAAQKNLSPLLFERVRKVLGEVKNGTALSLVYRCMGILGKRHPNVISKEVDTIALTFEAVARVEDEVAYAIVDCLTQWLDGVRKTEDQSLKNHLKSLTQEFITHENSKCRLVAVKYMEIFVVSDEIDLKWMLLKSCGDDRDEIRGVASRLLEMSLQVNSPVETTVEFLWERLRVDIVDFETGKDRPQSSQIELPLVHQMSSRYIWALLGRAAGFTDIKIADSGHDLEVAPKIVEQVTKLPISCQKHLTGMSLQAVRETREVALFHIAACFFAACPPEHVSVSLIVTCIQRARGSTRSELASVAAHLATSLLSSKEREDTLTASARALEEANVNAGECWIASSVIAAHPTSRSTVVSVLNLLLNIAEDGYSKSSSVLESALGSMANIFRTILRHDKDFAMPAEDQDRMLSICEKIAVSRKDAVTTKAHEEAACVMGFSATTMNETTFDKLTSALYRIGTGPPQQEVQLIVGSALYDVALGPFSNSRRNLYTTPEEEFKLSSTSPDIQERIESRLNEILSKIFGEKLTSPNHHERRSALIWLLVIVRRSFKAQACMLQSMLAKIQSAFGIGLSENDDFMQDIASIGIGLVYEMASAEQRKSLVNDLIAVITEGKAFSTAKIDANTEIFSKDQHITGPDGQHLNTFKELCSLATDLNQPDLVYKFMNLARHNAVWNIKKGAALGFAALLEEATAELEPYLGQLVPKLFRYRYDPDLKVRESMRSIWSVLTKSRHGLVEVYADEIAKELMQQLTSSEWRVRESSCLALADLIQSNDSYYLHSITPALILTVFRLRDDVKESVRLAANRAIQNLGKLAVRLSNESSKGNDPRAFIGSLMPILIRNGVNSETKVNKQFSISLLLELSKNVGYQLRPHLAELIPSLLDTISDTEPSILNYVAARSTLVELEALDDARAKMARTSPMMSAINDLLPQIDSCVFVAMQPRLCEQLRSSAGASTRIACAQLLIALSLRAPQLLEDHRGQCDKLFNTLISGARDRNPSVRKHFANAATYLAKYASSSSFEASMRTVLQDLLGDDVSMKQSARNILKGLSTNCSELLQGHCKLIVPYIFLETCKPVAVGDDTSSKLHDSWCELWNEIVPSTDAAVRMYRASIITFAVDILQNNDVWSVRVQAARMLSETITHLRDRIDPNDTASLLSSLKPILFGRVWPGKENLLAAVAAIFTFTGSSLRQVWSEKEVDEMFAILCREASKKKKSYAAEGLLACGSYVRNLPYPKGVIWIIEKVECNVKKAMDLSEGDEHSEEELERSMGQPLQTYFIGQNLSALANAVGAYSEGEEAKTAIHTLSSYLTYPGLFWKAKQTLISSVANLSRSWQLHSVLDVTELVDALLKVAEEMLEQQRKSIAMQSVSVISTLAQRRQAFAVQWYGLKTQWETSRVVQETGCFDDLASILDEASVKNSLLH